jgi:AraC-like DNA-binding protein
MNKNISITIPAQTLDKLEFSTSFTVYRAGYFYKYKEHDVKRTGINEYVLLLCIDGKGYVNTDNQKYTVTKGYIAILNKNHPHSYGSDKSDPWTILWLHFSGSEMENYYKTLKSKTLSSVFYRGDYLDLADNINRILSCLEESFDTISVGQASCYMQLFLLSLLKPDTIESSGNNYINKTISFMNNMLFTDMALQDFANFTGISTYHLIRLFKKHTNLTPMQYFNNLKIKKACWLISTTELCISDISDKLCYNNSFYFSRQFKSIIGESPSSYRKNYKDKYS